MSPEALDKLIIAAGAIAGMNIEGRTPAEIVADLVENHGAKLSQGGSGHQLRLAGVTGTCTWSADTGLLASWLGNATKRIKASGRAVPGDNRRQGATATDDRLRLLIERVERLEEEKKGIADDIRDVFGEAKAVGYDVKIMRQIVRLRKMKPEDRAEMETILDLYKAALGLG